MVFGMKATGFKPVQIEHFYSKYKYEKYILNLLLFVKATHGIT